MPNDMERYPEYIRGESSLDVLHRKQYDEMRVGIRRMRWSQIGLIALFACVGFPLLISRGATPGRTFVVVAVPVVMSLVVLVMLRRAEKRL